MWLRRIFGSSTYTYSCSCSDCFLFFFELVFFDFVCFALPFWGVECVWMNASADLFVILFVLGNWRREGRKRGRRMLTWKMCSTGFIARRGTMRVRLCRSVRLPCPLYLFSSSSSTTTTSTTPTSLCSFKNTNDDSLIQNIVGFDPSRGVHDWHTMDARERRLCDGVERR